LERLEATARSRAASRRAERRPEKPAKLTPEEEEQQLYRNLQILRILVDVGALELAAERCPRTAPGEPLCDACRQWQTFGQSQALQDSQLVADDEACEHWRAISELVPRVSGSPDDAVLPEYPESR
jgi:hypothetical protein